MNAFGHDPDSDHVPFSRDIEGLLLATRPPEPSWGMRERVLASMEIAAEERRSILAAHRPIRPDPRSRVLPEAIAGVAAALCVLLAPWLAGERGSAAAAPAPEAVRLEAEADEAPDVHLALELLAARRERFAGTTPEIAALRN